MIKLCRARSFLYRRQFLQESIRWKALEEIYRICMRLHRSDLNVSAKFRQIVLAFSTLEMLKSSIFKYFSNFVVIFADFHEICSDFLRYSRKTLQQLLLEISRFQFNFSMIILEIHLIFYLIFDLIFDLIIDLSFDLIFDLEKSFALI